MTGFRTTESSLYDYVLTFPEPAHLKDPQSKKYICSNEHNLKIYGLNNPEMIVGMTVHDLDNFMKPYWGSNFVYKIDEFDSIVSKEKIMVNDNNRIFLDKFGLVHVQNMIKMPVLGANQSVTSILTTSFDITHTISRVEIFYTYRKIYPKRRDASEYFMKHIRIDPFFREILSNKEMLCLLYMLENNSHKYISSRLHISPRTVETHISSISNKLNNKSLTEIIEFLRITANDRDI